MILERTPRQPAPRTEQGVPAAGLKDFHGDFGVEPFQPGVDLDFRRIRADFEVSHPPRVDEHRAAGTRHVQGRIGEDPVEVHYRAVEESRPERVHEPQGRPGGHRRDDGRVVEIHRHR